MREFWIVTQSTENKKIAIKRKKRGHDKGPSLSVFCARVSVQFDVIDPMANFQQCQTTAVKNV